MIIKLVQCDDQVPEPGSGHVGPHKDWTNRYGKDTVKEEVYWVPIGCGCCYGSLPLMMALEMTILSKPNWLSLVQ